MGVGSPGVMGWFYLNARNTHLEKNSSNFNITLAFNQMDYGKFNPSIINGFNIQVPGGTAFNVSFPSLAGLNNTINPNWIDLVHKYNISYIMLDKTLVSGNIETYNYTYKALFMVKSSRHSEE